MGGEALRPARRALALALWAATCAAACAAPRPAAGPIEWRAERERGHPLVGRIYDLAARREVGEAELDAALGGARFVLLGESHGHPDHAPLMARVLRALARGGAAPAVAFEMMRRDRQPALDELSTRGSTSADDVRAAVAWDESGWPPFSYYAPVFEAAVEARLPLVAADLTREDRAEAAAEAPSPEARARFGLDEPLPDPVRAALERDLLDAHCGKLPASALPRLVRVQRARDAELARALLRAAGAGEAGPREGAQAPEPGAAAPRARGEAGPHPPAQQPGSERTRTEAVLVAGAEHVRLDRGVPRALARLAPGADAVSLALLEVDAGERDPWTALERRYGPEPVFDFVWYTPIGSEDDPCERIRPPAGELR